MNLMDQVKGSAEDLQAVALNSFKPDLWLRSLINILAVSAFGVFVLFPLLKRVPFVKKIVP